MLELNATGCGDDRTAANAEIGVPSVRALVFFVLGVYFLIIFVAPVVGKEVGRSVMGHMANAARNLSVYVFIYTF